MGEDMIALLRAADAMAEALADAQRCGHTDAIGWWDNAMKALAAYEAVRREADEASVRRASGMTLDAKAAQQNINRDQSHD